MTVRPIVFVAAGDVGMRGSLASWIERSGWESRTFASAQEFLSQPRVAGPSVLVLDVALPGLSGLALQRVVANRVDMPVVFLTGDGDVETTVRAMKAGALEVLAKPVRREALIEALVDALELSRAALAHEAEMKSLRDAYGSLSRREREVMELVVSGLLNKQVAGELRISEITVKAHRGQVMRKMGADSLAGLVTMAGRLGLITPWVDWMPRPRSDWTRAVGVAAPAAIELTI